MSELPKGWSTCKVDQLCLKPEQVKPADDFKFLYIDIGSVDRETKSISTPTEILGCDAPSRARKVVNAGDVIVSMTRPNLNAVAKITKQFDGQIASTGFDVLKPILIETEWLFAVVKSKPFIDAISGTTIGALYPACKASDIRNYEMPLPPLPEQKRIVEKLDEVLAQVDTIKARLDGIPELLKRFRQSVLANATAGVLSKKWRELNSPLPKCKDEVVEKVFIEWCKSKEAEFARKGKLQKNDKWKENFPMPDFGAEPVSCWNAINLASVAEVIDPNPSHRMPKYIDNGLPFISSENIVNLSCIDFAKGKKIQEEELNKQKTRYEVKDGTFAFTRIGTIGKSVLLPLPHNYGISHAMAIVNPFQSLIDSRFLILAMNCKSILSQAHDGVQSVGVPDLGIGKMKSFIVPLPSKKEQKEIVRLVDQYFAFADTIEAQVKKAQARVDNLTQSILAKAFRGELVPQNDDDEPAEVLLERIAQARKEAEALAKAAKKAEAAKKGQQIKRACK
ncbi:restriction endonuclease subunit S [Vibrio parahaemolyticus]|uniref:restriction endonuclease subunit S n=1 Tax=Vibrio parahaemolyticus TaxID=670 RepID=UPI000541ABD9|nr:restriction endonuclease subunit S [Vibrio parahaemolyticus]EHR6472051.1 restriction endonuclease subunit S [Vibrio parahaemolyticus]KHF16005.1 hypothetical protein PO81_21770 [Vibrio parahaemolyticus]